MPDYDFHTLSWEEFQLLVRDLLNAREKCRGEKIYFKSFPAGKDQGIDLLYEPFFNERKYIVQVKRYIKTSFPTILSNLTQKNAAGTSEIDKVKQHDPQRYIFVTSADLTLANKETLKQKFSPYVPTIDDIIDRTDVNQLLGEFRNIESDYSKLWFPSTQILELLLHKATINRGKYLIESIRQKKDLYVIPDGLHEALHRLQTDRCLIITGPPGIGKTSYAEILTSRLIAEQTEVYHIYSSVEEAEPLLKEDSSPQLFYFDDFLGHNKIEMQHAGLNEYAFFIFLERLLRLPNKYFLATTRSSLFNEFQGRSERYKNAGIDKFKLYLPKAPFLFSKRIQLFKSHFIESQVPGDYQDDIPDFDDHWRDIVEHANFSPRMVEFVTTKMNYSQTPANRYYSYIIDQMDNPGEIWAHAYHQQLQDTDRFLLTTLFSFNARVPRDMLEISFNKRLEYEIRENGIPLVSDAFETSWRKLIDGFLIIDEAGKVDFINLSFADYLRNYLDGNKVELNRIANSVGYIEQILHRFLPPGSGGITLSPSRFLYDRLTTQILPSAIGAYNYDASVENTYLGIMQSLVLTHYFGVEETQEALSLLLNMIDWQCRKGWPDHRYLLSFLTKLNHLPMAIETISPWMEELVPYIMKDYWDYFSIGETVAVFEKYNGAYSAFLAKADNISSVRNKIEWFIIGEIHREVDRLKRDATSIDQVLPARAELDEKLQAVYRDARIDGTIETTYWDDVDWKSVVAENVYLKEYYESYPG